MTAHYSMAQRCIPRPGLCLVSERRRTCSRLSLYRCLEETLWLRCPCSCSTLPFNSSQWHFICESVTQKCPASPGVTNLVRASQSASMCSRAAICSSKALSTVCSDATRTSGEQHAGGDKREVEKINKKTEYHEIDRRMSEKSRLLFFFPILQSIYFYILQQIPPQGRIKISSYFFLGSPVAKLIVSLAATLRELIWNE